MANPFTPEQISQILEEFFKVVGTRQYIGARYVPIFGRKNEESIEWDNSAPYEPLTIVLYQGNSYTSRQYVPAGVEITNQEFWALTGNYNAQIEQYRKEVQAHDTRITAIETSNTNQDAQLAGTSDSGLKTLIDANTTANSMHTGQLAGTEDSGLKALITENTTAISNEITARTEKDSTIESQLSGDSESGLKTLVSENAKQHENYVYAMSKYKISDSLYGLTLQKSWNGVDFGNMFNLPSTITTGYQTAVNCTCVDDIFYVNLDNFYYYTKDFVTWNKNTIVTFPSSGARVSASAIFDSGTDKYFIFAYTNDTTNKITTAVGKSYKFAIMSTKITINADGTIEKVSIDNCNTLLPASTTESHIDPSIFSINGSIYMMCKNEIEAKEEIYSVNDTFTSAKQVPFTMKGFGVEAGKVVKLSDSVAIAYYDPYMFRMDENKSHPTDGYVSSMAELVSVIYNGHFVSNDTYALTNQAYACHIAYFTLNDKIKNVLDSLGIIPNGAANFINENRAETNRARNSIYHKLDYITSENPLYITNYPYIDIGLRGQRPTDSTTTPVIIKYVKYFKKIREIIPIHCYSPTPLAIYDSNSKEYAVGCDHDVINYYYYKDGNYRLPKVNSLTTEQKNNTGSIFVPIPAPATNGNNGTIMIVFGTELVIFGVVNSTNKVTVQYYNHDDSNKPVGTISVIQNVKYLSVTFPNNRSISGRARIIGW